MHSPEHGHYCPRCGSGPFLCTIEDGQCDNTGTCDTCIGELEMDRLDRLDREPYDYDAQDGYW